MQVKRAAQELILGMSIRTTRPVAWRCANWRTTTESCREKRSLRANIRGERSCGRLHASSMGKFE
jgi:hypothetical protein